MIRLIKHLRGIFILATLAVVWLVNASAKTPTHPKRYITGKQYLELEVESFQYIKQQLVINISVAWDGSWRDQENHDAAWVFIKGLNELAEWQHISIDQASAPNQGLRTLSESVPEISVAKDKTGFFIYRKEQGAGDNRWSIELSINNAPRYTDINAYGLEMVYITRGRFELGTTKGSREREQIFVRESGGAPYNPFFKYSETQLDGYGGVYPVVSEQAIRIGKSNGDLFYVDSIIPGVNTYSGDQKGVLSEKFPKGFAAFYLMKYELTQAQYAEFLNSLSKAQQRNRQLNQVKEFGRGIADYRNSIKFIGGRFVAERPLRAANFISWQDGLAYSDWAGLRPMTELEFEKAARGPQPAVFLEYVFGINELGDNLNNIVLDRMITGSDEQSGVETIDGNYHTTMMKYIDAQDVCPTEPDYIACRTLTGGDGGIGPLRVGIHAASHPGDRVASGASYYGVMELSGNLQEPTVSVGHPYGRQFRGGHGDGVLTLAGDADTSDWMPLDGDMVFGGRGGSWPYSWNHARTADRFKAYRNQPQRRASHIGWRAARTANQ